MTFKFLIHTFCLFSFLFTICSCAQTNDTSKVKKANPLAVSYNDKAARLSLMYRNNPDSIKKAISYMDSAISIEPNYRKFYLLNKWAILYRTNMFDSAMNICNEVLNLDPINLMANYNKAMTFDRMNVHDSATYFYNKSLLLLDNPKSLIQKNNNWAKDYQKIILLKLINDSSININEKIDEFAEKYKDVEHIDDLVNDLKTFNKKIYLETY